MNDPDKIRVERFSFHGRSLEIRAEQGDRQWRIRVLENGLPATDVSYTVSYETEYAWRESKHTDVVNELMTLAQRDINEGIVKLRTLSDRT